MAALHGGPAAGGINHFLRCCESAIVIFCSGNLVLQHGRLVNSHAANRAPHQRHIGTFSLAWAEARWFRCWSWGRRQAVSSQGRGLPAAQCLDAQVLQACKAWGLELAPCWHAEDDAAGFPSIDGWTRRRARDARQLSPLVLPVTEWVLALTAQSICSVPREGKAETQSMTGQTQSLALPGRGLASHTVPRCTCVDP